MNFYVPFTYLFSSRIKSKHERISWLIIFPAFLLLTVILFDGNIINFLVSFVLTMSIYEIGYLDNDFRTVRKEKDPTIRTTEQRDWIEKKLFFLVILRVIVASIAGVYLYHSADSKQQNLLAVLIILLTLGFYFHNTLRSRLNVITYFVVVSCRYIIPLIAAVSISHYQYVIPFMIFVFPIVRTIEHACKEKYGFSKVKEIVKNPDVFRVKWYLLITFVLVISYIPYGNDTIGKLIILSTYFLLYRMTTLYFSRSKHVQRNKHQSYNWDNNEK